MKKRNYKKYYGSKRRRHIRKKKSVFRNRFFWFFALGVVIFAGLFYLFVFSPVFQIRELTVKGAKLLDAFEVEDLIKTQTERNILFFPTKSIFVFDKKWAKDLILEKFFVVDNLVIKKELPQRLSIKIKEKEAKAVFCLPSPAPRGDSDTKPVDTEPVEQKKCFLVDKEGFTFWQLAEEEVLDKPVIQSEEVVQLQDKVVAQEILDFVCLADIKLNQEAGLEISEFSVSPTKIEAKVSDGGWSIYFSPQKDLDLQIEDLILVLKNQISPEAVAEGEGVLGEGGGGPGESEESELFQDLEYIDLRFDKIFYK